MPSSFPPIDVQRRQPFWSDKNDAPGFTIHNELDTAPSKRPSMCVSIPITADYRAPLPSRFAAPLNDSVLVLSFKSCSWCCAICSCKLRTSYTTRSPLGQLRTSCTTRQQPYSMVLCNISITLLPYFSRMGYFDQSFFPYVHRLRAALLCSSRNGEVRKEMSLEKFSERGAAVCGTRPQVDIAVNKSHAHLASLVCPVGGLGQPYSVARSKTPIVLHSPGGSKPRSARRWKARSSLSVHGTHASSPCCQNGVGYQRGVGGDVRVLPCLARG